MAMRIQLGKRNLGYNDESAIGRGRKSRKLPPVVLKGYLAPKIEPAISDDEHIQNWRENEDEDGDGEKNRETVQCLECDRSFDGLPSLYEHCREEHPKSDGDNERGIEDTEEGVQEDGNDGDEAPAQEGTGDDSTHSNGTKIRTTWCDICKKHLATVSSRNLHMRIHTGERPFVCPFCNKSFTQNVHLRSHMSVHTGAKPYVCDLCGKGFVASRTLKIHMMSHSRDNNSHSCRMCGRKFLLRNQLILHFQSQHGVEQPTATATATGKIIESSSPPSIGHLAQRTGGSSRRTSKPKYHLQPPQRILVGNGSPSDGGDQIDQQMFSGHHGEDIDGQNGAQRQHGGRHDDMDYEWQMNSGRESDNEMDSSQAVSPTGNFPSIITKPISSVSREESSTRLSHSINSRFPTTWRRSGQGNRDNSKTNSTNEGCQQKSNNSECPNCSLVESELQLLKTELAVIKQFLGNKLTLMEQKIDNICVLIK